MEDFFRERPLPPGSTVLCAISGGADSVCLLHALCLLGREQGFAVRAAHYHHGIRDEEADRDECFVRQVCETWAVPLTVGHGAVPAHAARTGTSLEEAARQLRYRFLEETADALGCTVIATAHNADDNAETLLFHLLRGTGLRGLTGIPPVRGRLIRPLLSATRQSIEGYLAHFSLPHVEDSTNTDLSYARNRLRHQVLPVLRELNSQAVEHMGETARQLALLEGDIERATSSYLEQARLSGRQVRFPRQSLLSAPESLRPRLILGLVRLLDGGLQDLGQRHLESVLTLAEQGREGSCLSLPHRLQVRCGKGELLLEQQETLHTCPLPLGQTVHWGEYTLTLLPRPDGDGLLLASRSGMDALTVGPCPPAGRLTLMGSNGARTIKRLCLDRGLSLAQRDSLPAIFVNGRLAAVWRLGTDIHFLGDGDSPRRFIQIIQKTGDDQNDQCDAR